jgi:hypothetical protein
MLRPLARGWLILTCLWSAGCGSDPVLVVPETSPEPDIDSALPAPLELCPRLVNLEVRPLETGVGDSILLDAEAMDPDGDELAYRWRARGGAILDARAASTTFTCETRGPSTVRLSIRDEGGCELDESVDIACH